jgi:hypothetical protein
MLFAEFAGTDDDVIDGVTLPESVARMEHKDLVDNDDS